MSRQDGLKRISCSRRNLDGLKSFHPLFELLLGGKNFFREQDDLGGILSFQLSFSLSYPLPVTTHKYYSIMRSLFALRINNKAGEEKRSAQSWKVYDPQKMLNRNRITSFIQLIPTFGQITLIILCVWPTVIFEFHLL